MPDSDARYTQIFDAVPDGIIVVATDGAIVMANRQVSAMFGYSQEELIGTAVEILVPEGARACHIEHRQSFTASGHTRHLGSSTGLFGRRRDGSEFPVAIGLCPLPEGDSAAVCATIRDISDQVDRERILQENEARYAAFIQNSSEAIWCLEFPEPIHLDMSESEQCKRAFAAVFAAANEVCAKAYGYDCADDILGVKLSEVLPPAEPSSVETIAVSVRAQYRYTDLETIERNKAGETVIFLNNMVPTIEDGVLIRVWGTMRDVTEQRRMETRLAAMNTELAHMARVSSMGELASSLAHELNQPLTAIMNNAQAAQRFLRNPTPDLAEVAEILADIVSDDQRAGEVIRNLREFLRRGDIEKSSLDINSIVQDVLQILGTDAVVRQVTVEFAQDDALPPVMANRTQLQQIVLNLLLNAFEAMADIKPAERRLHISTIGGNSEVVIAVCDSGVGVDEDTANRIFDPFFTTKIDGMGMGLSVSRSIAEAHGGSMAVANNAGAGVTVSLILPTDNREVAS